MHGILWFGLVYRYLYLFMMQIKNIVNTVTHTEKQKYLNNKHANNPTKPTNI